MPFRAFVGPMWLFYLNKWVNEHLGQVFPVRTKHRMSLPPWITPETSNMIKRLNTAKKKFPSESPKLKFMSENCDKAVEDDKSQYETLLSNGRSTSALFKYFRSFTKGTLPSVMKYNDHEATNDQEKANLFDRINQFKVLRKLAFSNRTLICKLLPFQKGTLRSTFPTHKLLLSAF